MRIFLLMPVIVLVVSGCSPRATPEWFDSQMSDIHQRIFDARGDAWDTDSTLVLQGIDMARRFLERYPDDSTRVPRYRYELVKWYSEIGAFDSAIVQIDRIRTDYPRHELAPAMLHFKAYYIYDQGLKDYDNARILYMQFLDEYPDHTELVDAVLFSLEHLGRTDDEILHDLLEKRAAEGMADDESP